MGAIWGPAEQANILPDGSQKREKMAKPQFVKIRNLLKREKRLCKNPCWWNRARTRAGAKSGRGTRKNCHLLAARDVSATGLATYPTIITFSSHWAGERHSLHLQMGKLRLRDCESLALWPTSISPWHSLFPAAHNQPDHLPPPLPCLPGGPGHDPQLPGLFSLSAQAKYQ